MSESACTTTPSSPEVLSSSPGFDGYIVPGPEVVHSIALDAPALPLLQPPAQPQQLHWANPIILIHPPYDILSDIPPLGPPARPQQYWAHPIMPMPPPDELFLSESNDEHVHETPLSLELPMPGAPAHLAPTLYSRSPSPSVFSGSCSPVQQHRSITSEEQDNHFVRRWQQWNAYSKLWLPMNKPFPHLPRDIDDYFYLNVRPIGDEEHSSLVFSDFSPVLEALLRTVFTDVEWYMPFEFPVPRLFQKMVLLRSKLDDARHVSFNESNPDDLISKAEVFGFRASLGYDITAQYLADLIKHLGKLLEVVEAESKHKVQRFNEFLANNQITFDLLEYYYEEGAVYFDDHGIQVGEVDHMHTKIAGVLKRARFSDDGQQLNINLEYLEWDGVDFQKRIITYNKEAYQGPRPIASFMLQRMTDEMLAKVTEHGRLYLSYCRVIYAEHYNDTGMQDTSYVRSRVRRVMVDPFGYHHAPHGYNPNLRTILPNNAEENIARLPYWVGGYDLETREWQRFHILDLKPLEYYEEAWTKLVMDRNTKDLIRALVDSSGRSIGVSHSMQLSKGKNILLNGSPGTGRMTTVHAVCNLLKRPLLTISADDCQRGTNHISNIMSLAVTWNAVIVTRNIDELLESRYKGDIDCVNATLRQLEQDDCVSFWVTSGSSCPKELLSSFSAIINFPELNATARRQLWLNHFGQFEPAGHIPNNDHKRFSSSFGDQKKIDYAAHLRDIEKISCYQLDGKVIENIMRSARALADSNKEHLSVNHVKVVMKAQQLESSLYGAR